ncbi:MAG: hypothetical protein MUF21_06340 [Gemmatimonadaceae bacterium]|nr:hypothetical protein [Gemmatimonadaceae bacterium]
MPPITRLAAVPSSHEERHERHRDRPEGGPDAEGGGVVVATERGEADRRAEQGERDLQRDRDHEAGEHRSPADAREDFVPACAGDACRRRVVQGSGGHGSLG